MNGNSDSPRLVPSCTVATKCRDYLSLLGVIGGTFTSANNIVTYSQRVDGPRVGGSLRRFQDPGPGFLLKSGANFFAAEIDF